MCEERGTVSEERGTVCEERGSVSEGKGTVSEDKGRGWVEKKSKSVKYQKVARFWHLIGRFLKKSINLSFD